MATSTKFRGFKRDETSTTNPLTIRVAGQKRMDFGNTALTTEGATSAAILCGLGTSTTPVVTATAGKMMSFYASNTNTGTAEGFYFRHYQSGAGSSGECLRAFSTVNNVAAGDSYGAHLSLSFGTSGTVTGLGVAMRATLHIANQATQGGTLAAVQAEIWSDGATSDPSGSQLSVFRVVNDGNATGMADVDTDAFLFDFAGWSAGSANMWVDTTSNAADDFWKIRKPDGATAYLISSDSLTFA